MPHADEAGGKSANKVRKGEGIINGQGEGEGANAPVDLNASVDLNSTVRFNAEDDDFHI